MNPDRREFLALGIGALAVSALPIALRGRSALVRRRIPVMGTVAEVVVRSRNDVWAHRAIDAAFAELRRVEASMTRFRPDSDVGLLNSASGSWVPISEDTASVLSAAIEWASASGGRFDPCLGRASDFWDVAHRSRPPADGDAARFAHREFWSALDVDRGATVPRARLTEADAAVDLGGIAKGFGVDVAADALRRHGVFHGLVNVGGDLVALGHDRSGEPWRIGVRSPDTPDGIVDVLSLTDGALATSGDYLHFFEHGGRRYHHLLDPATGEPRRTAVRSLTIRADRCLDADAAATAVFGASERMTAEILARAAADAAVTHQLQETTS